MRTILIPISILLFTSCSKEKIKEPEIIESRSEDGLVALKIDKNSPKNINKPLLNREDNVIKKINCLGKSLDFWYGFDENIERNKCKKINSYKIEDYKCSIEQKAFGLDFNAIRITLNDNRIFAFESLEQCNEGLEMWEANGY